MSFSQCVDSIEREAYSSRIFDTPCLFGRDITEFRDFVMTWYGADLELGHPEDTKHQKLPRIVYPLDYMSDLDPVQKQLIDDFVKDLESLLGVKKTEISFAERWTKSVPEDLAGQSLQHFMKHAPTHAFFYDHYHNFHDFRTKYHAKFGKAPYVSPTLRWRWEIAKDLTRPQRDESILRLQTFKRWFLDEVMCVPTHTTMVVLPIEAMRPNYRDDPPSPPQMPMGIGMLDLAPTLGAPELVVPIGQISYDSRVSGQIEYLPVTLSLMGAPGTDLDLIGEARVCLEKAGRPTWVRVGSSMFAKEAGDETQVEDEK